MRHFSKCLRAALTAIVVCCSFLMNDALAAERFALIIGNETYKNVQALRNPTKDVMLIESSLKESNFAVNLEINLDSHSMRDVVDEFLRKLKETHLDKNKIEAVLFYYAGHGVQYAGENYLLPIDVIPTEDTIRKQGLNLNEVIDKFNAVPASSFIFVLDACRNNPISETTEGHGLAEVDAGPNNYLLFSARPGAVAMDGDDDTSPFASALGSEIRKQGLPIEVVSRNVRRVVYRETGGYQLPWDSSSLMDAFEFIPLTEFGQREELISETAREEAVWAFVEQTKFSEGSLRKYLLIYPDGKYSAKAREELNKQ